MDACASPAPPRSSRRACRPSSSGSRVVFAGGPERVERVAITSGGGGGDLILAASEGYDLFLTGEPEEPSLHAARELGVHFVAAGHYATERLGVQALAERLSVEFGIEREFLEVPNPI